MCGRSWQESADPLHLTKMRCAYIPLVLPSCSQNPEIKMSADNKNNVLPVYSSISSVLSAILNSFTNVIAIFFHHAYPEHNMLFYAHKSLHFQTLIISHEGDIPYLSNDIYSAICWVLISAWWANQGRILYFHAWFCFLCQNPIMYSKIPNVHFSALTHIQITPYTHNVISFLHH